QRSRASSHSQAATAHHVCCRNATPAITSSRNVSRWETQALRRGRPRVFSSTTRPSRRDTPNTSPAVPRTAARATTRLAMPPSRVVPAHVAQGITVTPPPVIVQRAPRRRVRRRYRDTRAGGGDGPHWDGGTSPVSSRSGAGRDGTFATPRKRICPTSSRSADPRSVEGGAPEGGAPSPTAG